MAWTFAWPVDSVAPTAAAGAPSMGSPSDEAGIMSHTMRAISHAIRTTRTSATHFGAVLFIAASARSRSKLLKSVHFAIVM